MHQKEKCQRCEKDIRRKNILFFRGRNLCKICFHYLTNNGSRKLPKNYNFEEVINRTYNIKGAAKNYCGYCNFHWSLIGRKFKIVKLVGNKRFLLNKVYDIYPIFKKKGSTAASGLTYFNKSLIGTKFKICLVD